MSIADSESLCPHCGALPGTSAVAAGICLRCLALSVFSEETPAKPGMAAGASERFGDYEILEEIARGGMGVVYCARQISLDRTVALKVMLQGSLASPLEISRFRSEARAASALSHPHIVGIYESGECDGRHFLSMEYVAGLSLADWTREGPLSGRKAAELMVKIAEAIQHAHNQGVLHRDLKPSNIIIDERFEPHVSDFGLARRMDADATLTQTSQILGTPGYMSPEQAGGRLREAGPSSDIYSLGAILYHMLTGRAPHTGETITQTLRHVVEDEPIVPRLLNPSVPRDLETIALKCLRKETLRRYASAQDLADDLRRFLAGEPIRARYAGAVERGWLWCRRRPVVAGLSAISLLLLAATAAASLIAANRIRASRRVAESNLYAADMRNALRSWDEGALNNAQAILAAHLPKQGEPDFRGFEWYYLRHLLEGEQWRKADLTVPSNWVDGALSPDGRFVLIFTNETLALLKAEDQRLLGSWHEVRPRWLVSFRRIASTSSGDQAAVSGLSGIRLWRQETGRLELLSDMGGEAIAFSPDGSKLAFHHVQTLGLASQGTVIMDVQGRRKLLTLPEEGEAIGWSADGSEITLVNGLGVLSRWNAVTGRPLSQLRCAFEPPAVLDFAYFSPNLRLVAGMNHGRGVFVCDTATGKQLLQLTNASWRSAQMAFSPDSRWLAEGDDADVVRSWDTSNWVEQPLLRGHLAKLFGIGFSPDGQTLVSTSQDGTLRWWRRHDAELNYVQRPDSVDRQLWSPIISPDNKLAALTTVFGLGPFSSEHGSSEALLWDCEGWKKRAAIEALPLAFSPDGKWLLALQNWRRFIFFDSKTLQATATFELPQPPRRHAPRISSDGHWIGAWELDLSAHIYDTASGEQALYLTNSCEDIAFSPDGAQVAATGTGQLWFCNLVNHKKVETDTRKVAVIAWAPSSQQVAATSGQDLDLIDARTGQITSRLVGHRATVGSLAFSSDGRTLASGGEDNTLRLWNVETAREVASIQTPSAAYFLKFSADDQFLLYGGAFGYGRLQAPRPTAREIPTENARRSLQSSFWQIASGSAGAASPVRWRESAECCSNLLTLCAACNRYKTQRGHWPNHLQDLAPAFVNAECLICPASRQNHTNSNEYLYYFSTDPFAGPLPEFVKGATGLASSRSICEQLAQRYGPEVPILACFVHGTARGEVLNVNLQGQIFRSGTNWVDEFESRRLNGQK